MNTDLNTPAVPCLSPTELAAMPAHRLSIVIPMYNEVDNAAPMLARVHEGMAGYAHPWELILVDDGSSDGTAAALRQCGATYGKHVRVVELMRNFKQTAAMQAGLDASRGDVIVTLDGDLQNDPADIPRLVRRLLVEDLDLVAGWRKDRQDGLWLRKVPSRIANRLIARITGVKLNDYGCSLKAYRANVIQRVRLSGEMHRFIPAWMATITSPRRISEEVVNHHARIHGESKYGISRTFRVILDLISVFFFMRFRARPGHFFGGVGLGFGAIGTLILMYMGVLKMLGESIGTRPLLMVGFFALIMGVQFILTGVLAETLSRIDYQSGAASLYQVRHPEIPNDDDWQNVARAV